MQLNKIAIIAIVTTVATPIALRVLWGR